MASDDGNNGLLTAEELLPLVYDELRKLAAQKLAHEKPGQTLQPTALVHEAYLRLVGSSAVSTAGPQWDNRRHFFAAAAEAMRRILVERARRKNSVKGGGQRSRIDLDEGLTWDEPHEDVLELNEALDQLADCDPRAAELVKLRFFASLTGDQAAAVLSISPRAADFLWAYARAWLYEKLTES